MFRVKFQDKTEIKKWRERAQVFLKQVWLKTSQSLNLDLTPNSLLILRCIEAWPHSDGG